MMCDIDELVVALAMTRSARDHLARHLPNNFVQDSPEQMALLQRMNDAFLRLSQATLEMRNAIDAYLPRMTIIVAQERAS